MSAPATSPGLAAVVVAPNGVLGPLRSLVDRLSNAGVTVTAVDELEEARDHLLRSAVRAALVLDCRQLATDDPQDMVETSELIRRAKTALPDHRPIVVVSGAPNSFIVAAFRAGAGDLIDMAIEGTTHARAVVARACADLEAKVSEREQVGQWRGLGEEFLRELIRTERQRLDLEAQLEALRAPDNRGTPQGPLVCIVEDDAATADRLSQMLSAKGLHAYVFASGEAALAGIRAIHLQVDLALIDVSLPGMSGLDTMAQLRHIAPGISIFLMANQREHDALQGEELGIAGFVLKPFEHPEALTAKLQILANDAAAKGKELRYVQRIKERHGDLLERMRRVGL